MSINEQTLVNQDCRPLNGAEHALSGESCQSLMAQIPGWQLAADQQHIHKQFQFANFHHTMAFINAVAFIAHREDHHPDVEFGYNRCLIRLNTHDVGGLSINDFICAAKIEALLTERLR
jgi:4a-hydroxytetrahydrobiopterin dehydratase